MRVRVRVRVRVRGRVTAHQTTKSATNAQPSRVVPVAAKYCENC